ncbi:hypothetical protein GW813_05740, partial [bacterium]|nr:hypothetical protein [bacterium]
LSLKSQQSCFIRCLFTLPALMALWAGIGVAGTPLVNFDTGSSLVTNLKAHHVGDLLTIIIT